MSHVGGNAIQLAVAAGYSIVSTSSPKNFAYVKSLGATHVFDYNSKRVARDIVTTLKGKYVVGALSIGEFGDLADARCRHRGFAGVDIGDDGGFDL